jgi:hypothetical protein
MIEAFITNMGKYSEEELLGEWLKLPASKEEVKALLERIGIDGNVYKNTFITDYRFNLDELDGRFQEHENIDELNYLATILTEMDEREQNKFEAILQYGFYNHDVKDLINLTHNMHCYDYEMDITNHEELGQYYMDDIDTRRVPERFLDSSDYEAYGRHITLGDNGVFTKDGYMTQNKKPFIEHYKGRYELPQEHKIYEYPDPPSRMPIKQQLEMFSRMAALYQNKEEPLLVREGR